MSLKERFIKQNLINNKASKEETEPAEKVQEIVLNTEEISFKEYTPLDLLLAEADVSEIYINCNKNIFIRKNNVLQKSELYFKDNDQLLKTITSILDKNNLKIDYQKPLNKFHLFNNATMNLILPPISADGPIVIIKKTTKINDNLETLLQKQFLTKEMAETISVATKKGLGILISGPRSSGKTALINALSKEFPENQTVILVDDNKEFELENNQVLKIETSNDSYKNLQESIENIKPHRIVIDNANAKHLSVFKSTLDNGLLLSLCTESNPASTICSLLTSYGLSNEAAKILFASAIKLIIKIDNIDNGLSKITAISEVSYTDRLNITELFSFKKGSKNISGTHISCGIKPEFIKSIKDKDLNIPTSYFNKERKHSYSAKKVSSNKSPAKKSNLKSRFINNSNDFS